MSEAKIQNQIRLALAPHGSYFRANVGTGWRGREYVKMGRDILIKECVPLSTGLPPGFSDLFGATPVTITPDMVGQTLPVFTAIEVKSPTGRLRKEQKTFLTHMETIGAYSGVARSPDDAYKIINKKRD